MIVKYDTYSHGYNMTLGGDNMFDRTGLSFPNYNKHKFRTNEHKRKLGLAHLGKPKNYKNGRTKSWDILCPNGSVKHIENLQSFERENKLSINSLRNTIRTKKHHYSEFQVLNKGEL